MQRQPGKIVCVGRNYGAHARELGNDVPEEPLIFLKPPSAVIGPGDPIALPAVSQRVDYEAEIGVVMNRKLRNGDTDRALSAIGGIVCANDVTARDLQRADRQWTRAKGFDTFCPVGPEVVPLSVLPTLDALEVYARVNGEVRQHGYSKDMAFSIPFLVSYISQIMTLEPGDLILTGTPEGVGPLAPGDTVSVEIPGVGILENPVIRQVSH